MKPFSRGLAAGVTLIACLLLLLAAVPSQTDFDGAYFKTNALPISLVGTLTNWTKLSTNVFAPLASPALTGTPTINGQSIETQLTNKVDKTIATAQTLTGTLIAPEVDAAELYTGSFKLYRGALTPIDAGIALDFGSTNRYWSLSLTGAVTFADAINLTAGKHANVMITGVATNAAYVFPATWIFIGYKPTYLTANKHADIYLKSTSGANSGVWAYYGEEQ